MGDIMLLWTFTMISAGVVGITGVIPALLIPRTTTKYLSSKEGRSYMNCFLSFAVGSILGDTFLHLLPETWEFYQSHPKVGKHSQIGIFILIGIVIFLVIEKLFTGDSEKTKKEEVSHQENEEHSVQNGKRVKESQGNVRKRKGNESSSTCQTTVEKRPSSVKVQGYLNLLANVVDNFVHGLAVGASYSMSTKCGFLTTLCILIHEIPHEVSDFAILLRSGFDRVGAIQAQLITASSSLFGALAALMFDAATAGVSKAYILPFSCGGFLYVALVTLVPDLTKEEDPIESVKQIFLILIGIGLASGLAMFHV